MALAYSNTLSDPSGSLSGSGKNLTLASPLSSLSSSVLANAKARGVGAGLSVAPNGAVSTGLNPTSSSANSTTGSSTAAVGSGLVNPASVWSYKGVAITPGSDSDVSAQLAKIDAAGQPQTASGTVPLTFATTGGTTTGTTSTTSTTPPSPTFNTGSSGVVGSLVNTANQSFTPTQQVTDANNALTQFRTNEAGYVAGINAAPTSARIMQGRDQAVQLANAQTENALSTGVQNALTSQGQGITQRGQNITALGTAASDLAPQTVTPGQAVFNPGTGTYSSASSGGSASAPATAPSGIDQNSWNQYIQDYASGNFGAIPSSVTGNTNLSGQLQQAVQAQNPNFDYNTALGTGQGNQTLGATAGGIASGQSQEIANYKSAQQQGQNLASQASDLINTFGLNPSELTAANGAIQKIAQNVSSPQYQILNNYLNDISARYSQILTPPGGTATDTTRSVATGMLNALASGTSIQTVLSALDAQASAVIAGIPATGTVPGSSGGPSTTTGGTSGGQYQNGATTSAGGYNFTYQNGQWVAN